jgi:hypothetical protein
MVAGAKEKAHELRKAGKEFVSLERGVATVLRGGRHRHYAISARFFLGRIPSRLAGHQLPNPKDLQVSVGREPCPAVDSLNRLFPLAPAAHFALPRGRRLHQADRCASTNGEELKTDDVPRLRYGSAFGSMTFSY